MADAWKACWSKRGRLLYKPPDSSNEDRDDQTQSRLFDHFTRRLRRNCTISISRVTDASDLRPPPPPYTKSQLRVALKLAGSRDSAFRLLRSVIAQHSTAPKDDAVNTSLAGRRRSSTLGAAKGAPDMPSVDFLKHQQRSFPSNGSPLARPSLQPDSRTDSSQSGISSRSIRSSSTAAQLAPEEKPLASGNGVSILINLAEPALFLQGYDQHDTVTRNTAMLRGSLRIRVQKPAKVKAITLKFKGTAMTRWPEGIPPRKVEFEETDTLMSHTWPFFNAQFPTAEGGSCADHVQLANPRGEGEVTFSNTPMSSAYNISTKDAKRLSLQNVKSSSFDKLDTTAKPVQSVAQRGYRMFQPGDYYYNFELPLDSRLPETVDVELGFVKYELEASVERTGPWRSNLTGTKEVTLIRAPSEGSLEQVEPIAISRNWEDQLHYDIVISGKSFPLGSRIPIAFKLTPLAKVQLHRVKVFITENVEYFCSNKRVHRIEPTKKVLLFEKKSDGSTTSTYPGSASRITAGGGIPWNQREAAARGEEVSPQDPGNLLGHLEGEGNIGPTEMEFTVQLPGCQQSLDKEKSHVLNFDTTYHNIQVHHWIKIVMRLSRPETPDSPKRRHFEISIDSPFHILSCRANQTNTALPSYTSPESAPNTGSQVTDCNCPGAPRRRISPNSLPTINTFNENLPSDSSSEATSTSDDPSRSSTPTILPLRSNLARPQPAHVHELSHGHVQRPMHILRVPSFNPPSFEEEEPPPPMATPPPQYNDIASPTEGHGLADYFSRFHDAYDHEDSSDDDRSHSSGRVNLPLTPGGRVHRSMDLGRRGWPDLSAGGQ